jgi:hypothetical protein
LNYLPAKLREPAIITEGYTLCNNAYPHCVSAIITIVGLHKIPSLLSPSVPVAALVITSLLPFIEQSSVDPSCTPSAPPDGINLCLRVVHRHLMRSAGSILNVKLIFSLLPHYVISSTENRPSETPADASYWNSRQGCLEVLASLEDRRSRLTAHSRDRLRVCQRS